MAMPPRARGAQRFFDWLSSATESNLKLESFDLGLLAVVHRGGVTVAQDKADGQRLAADISLVLACGLHQCRVAAQRQLDAVLDLQPCALAGVLDGVHDLARATLAQ